MFRNKNIFIALTYQCNAFCKKCMTRYHINLHKTMSRKTLDNFLHLLKKNNFQGVVSVGSGEPLLYNDIEYFVQELLKINSSIRLRILTNGMALNKKLPVELFSGRCKIGVTFDAFYQESLAEVQKGVDIEQVKYNVSHLAQKYGGDCFYLNYTIYRNNINQLVPFCQFGLKNKINEIYATELKVFTGYELDLKDVSVICDDTLSTTIQKARELLEHNSVNSKGIDIFRSSYRSACYLRNLASPIVDVDGNVAFCSGREDMYVGNIEQENISDLWNDYMKKICCCNESWCSLCYDRQQQNGTYRLPATIRKGRDN